MNAPSPYDPPPGGGPDYNDVTITGTTHAATAHTIVVTGFDTQYDDVNAPGSIDPVYSQTENSGTIILRDDGDGTLAPIVAITTRRIWSADLTIQPSITFSLRPNDDKEYQIASFCITAACS